MRKLEEIYKEIHLLGIVTSGREFGEWLNRSESYLSSSKSRGRRISTEALLALVSNVSEVIDSTNEASVLCSDKSQIMEFQEGIKALKILENEAWTEIWRRVR
ncbi:protein of unknown function [Magnetospirillum sp. XM-1]|uniref:DUF6626 family protein n=1 Tax=Magnetospirillum sp. XM-1 TaxID=1663591 RepID=UPI00073DFFAF|nr:DUF6626 family protein [Magnetospirillum sp. XM-1]CUW37522.1 protein of unknown function [Magnetospirillum sp. XM-1]